MWGGGVIYCGIYPDIGGWARRYDDSVDVVYCAENNPAAYQEDLDMDREDRRVRNRLKKNETFDPKARMYKPLHR